MSPEEQKKVKHLEIALITVGILFILSLAGNIFHDSIKAFIAKKKGDKHEDKSKEK
jgi:hypothetical protein